MASQRSRSGKNNMPTLYTGQRRALFIKAVPVPLFSTEALTEHFHHMPVVVSHVSLRGSRKQNSRRTAVVTFKTACDAALAILRGRSYKTTVLDIHFFEPYHVRQANRRKEREGDWRKEKRPALSRRQPDCHPMNVVKYQPSPAKSEDRKRQEEQPHRLRTMFDTSTSGEPSNTAHETTADTAPSMCAQSSVQVLESDGHKNTSDRPTDCNADTIRAPTPASVGEICEQRSFERLQPSDSASKVLGIGVGSDEDVQVKPEPDAFKVARKQDIIIAMTKIVRKDRHRGRRNSFLDNHVQPCSQSIRKASTQNPDNTVHTTAKNSSPSSVRFCESKNVHDNTPSKPIGCNVNTIPAFTPAATAGIGDQRSFEGNQPDHSSAKVIGIGVRGDEDVHVRPEPEASRVAQGQESILLITKDVQKDRYRDQRSSFLDNHAEHVAHSIPKTSAHGNGQMRTRNRFEGFLITKGSTDPIDTSPNGQWIDGQTKLDRAPPAKFNARGGGTRSEHGKYIHDKLRTKALEVAQEHAMIFAKAREARNGRYRDRRNKLLAKHAKHIAEVENIIRKAIVILQSLAKDGLSRAETLNACHYGCEHLERAAGKIRRAEEFLERAELWPWEGLPFPQLLAPTLSHLRGKGHNAWNEIENIRIAALLKTDESVEDEEDMKGPVEAVLHPMQSDDFVPNLGFKPCIDQRSDKRYGCDRNSNPRKRQREDVIHEEKPSVPKRRRSLNEEDGGLGSHEMV